MSATCPSCGRPEHDGLLCKRCTEYLTRDLQSMPEWLRELDLTLSRQTGKMENLGGKASKNSAIPAPANLDALKVYSYVRNQLQTWVRELALGDDRDLADNPRAWAHWLAKRVQRMRMHPAVDELISEIDYCHKLIRRVVDRPMDRIYVGECGICKRAIHAPADADAVVCPRCKAAGVEPLPEVLVIPRRAELLATAEGRELPAAEVLHMIALFWQVTIPRRTFRTWVERGQLQRANDASEDLATYRVGDVLVLAQRKDVPA